MASFYTPPGWLSIWGLLDQLALKQFNQKIDCANKQRINTILKTAESFAIEEAPSFEAETGAPFLVRKNSAFTSGFFDYDILHFNDLESLTNFQKAPLFPKEFKATLLNIDLSEDYQKVKREIAEGSRSRPSPIQWGTFSEPHLPDYPLKVTYRTGSTVPIVLNHLNDLLFWKAFFEARRLVRDALADGTLQGYVYHEDVYKEVPSIIWHADEHWYHLLGKGRIAAYIPSILLQDQVCGAIFFNKENADNWISSTPSDQQETLTACDADSQTPLSEKPLINLGVYSTPWLIVLNDVYKNYGKEELGHVSKDCLESFMKAYITEKGLDIAPSDIPLLAKFLRLPEQKKGRAYQLNKDKK